jgi:hypothetical protein
MHAVFLHAHAVEGTSSRQARHVSGAVRLFGYYSASLQLR